MIFSLFFFLAFSHEPLHFIEGNQADLTSWGDQEAFLREYRAKYNSSADNGLDLRVSKALYSKGYSKVRVSVITQSRFAPSGLDWKVSERFSWKWTGNFIHSTVIDAVPGGTKTLTLNGQNVDIKLPAENKGTRGIMFADPCLIQSQWCSYGWYDILGKSTEFLNTVMKKDGMDYWYIIGDNFYDMNGQNSKSYFDRLTLDVKSKATGMVLGNHDFWIGGSPGNGQDGDQLGIGMTQWWGQDTAASLQHPIFDWRTNPKNHHRDSTPPIAVANTVWWNKMGNLGFIGYSGAHPMRQVKPYLDQACQQFSNDNLAHIFLLGHWDAQNLGCQNSMAAPDVLRTMKTMGSCRSLTDKMHFIDGHNHQNKIIGSDGFMIGGNGMSGSGQFGHMYVKSDDNGGVQIWYFEFKSKYSDNWNSIIRCLRAHDIDDCTHLATLWWNGVPLSDSCKRMEKRMAIKGNDRYTCGQRIDWLMSSKGMSWEQAYAQVHSEFPIICTCNPNESQSTTSIKESSTSAPEVGTSCYEMKNKNADGHTCGDRMNWLETTKGYSDAQAYAEVNSEYPTICVCDNPPTGKEGSGAPVCVFDIDGTLLNGVDESLSRAAIQACKDKGYSLAVNTAENKNECAGNRGRLAALGLSVPDQVYTCLSNYDWGTSKSLNMRTISSYYTSPSKCTLLFDDNQGNIDAVKKSGWLGQKIHNSRSQPGISPSELQQALAQLANCGAAPGPTPKPGPTPGPTYGPCSQMVTRNACDHDGCHLCGSRIQWLEDHKGMTPAQAFAEVAKEFPGVCQCDDPPTNIFPQVGKTLMMRETS